MWRTRWRTEGCCTVAQKVTHRATYIVTQKVTRIVTHKVVKCDAIQKATTRASSNVTKLSKKTHFDLVRRKRAEDNKSFSLWKKHQLGEQHQLWWWWPSRLMRATISGIWRQPRGATKRLQSWWKFWASVTRFFDSMNFWTWVASTLTDSRLEKSKLAAGPLPPPPTSEQAWARRPSGNEFQGR